MFVSGRVLTDGSWYGCRGATAWDIAVYHLCHTIVHSTSSITHDSCIDVWHVGFWSFSFWSFSFWIFGFCNSGFWSVGFWSFSFWSFSFWSCSFLAWFPNTFILEKVPFVSVSSQIRSANTSNWGYSTNWRTALNEDLINLEELEFSSLNSSDAFCCTNKFSIHLHYFYPWILQLL